MPLQVEVFSHFFDGLTEKLLALFDLFFQLTDGLVFEFDLVFESFLLVLKVSAVSLQLAYVVLGLLLFELNCSVLVFKQAELLCESLDP